MSKQAFPLVDSLPELEQRIQRAAALAVWFSGPDCRVCSDLKPKLASLLDSRFPLMETALVDCARTADVAARYQVFSVPTLLVFFDRRESLRKVRNMSLRSLESELQRPYHLLFD